MKRTQIFCVSVAAALSTGLGTKPAMAQDCYRMVDIADLGFIPNPNNITFGLNDQHQAVGAYKVGLKKHAFLWLPVPAYNLNEGFHDLHTLAGLHADAESAGYEINDAGMAVGWADIEVEPGTFKQHAFVWRLDIVPFEFIDLATYSVPDDGAPKLEVPTVAWAINNDVPPVVVGDASGLTDCACPPDEPDFGTPLGFKAVLGTNMLQELLPIFNPPTCDNASFGRDIGALAVGYSAGPGVGLCIIPEIPCDPTKDAVRYFPSGAPDALTDFSLGGSESRGVNDIASIVGWGFENEDDDDGDCQMSAVFWENPAAAPFNLGSLLPVGQESRAEAISNPDGGGIMIVVGANQDTFHALRWQGSGQTWSVVDLNDKIVNQCGGPEGFIVIRADDVSDDGWIISIANANPGGPADLHAVILIPDQDCQMCCFADLDCNGIVGASDLLTLLVSWGPCLGCPADLDCNGTVGASDLLSLLTAWGPCAAPIASEPPQDVLDCVERFCCEEEDLVAFENCICLVDPECDITP